MEKLVEASLKISKAIKWDTKIWYNEIDCKEGLDFGFVLDFKTLNKEPVCVIFFKMSDSVEKEFNTLIMRLKDLKSWIEDNRSCVYVNGTEITIHTQDALQWNFTKKRLVKIVNWEETKPMEQIVPNGLKQISVEVRKGVFVDLLLDPDSGKHYTWNWEFKREGKRGAYKGVKFYDAIGQDLVEYELG